MAGFGTFVDGVSLTAAELNTFLDGTSFTPVFRQSVTLTNNSINDSGNYQRIQKLVFCAARAELSSAGTANNRIEFDLPVTAAANAERVIGTGYVFDQSAASIIRVAVVRVSTTRVAFLTNSSTSLTTYLGQTGGPTLTIANADAITLTMRYEAA